MLAWWPSVRGRENKWLAVDKLDLECIQSGIFLQTSLHLTLLRGCPLVCTDIYVAQHGIYGLLHHVWTVVKEPVTGRKGHWWIPKKFPGLGLTQGPKSKSQQTLPETRMHLAFSGVDVHVSHLRYPCPTFPISGTRCWSVISYLIGRQPRDYCTTRPWSSLLPAPLSSTFLTFPAILFSTWCQTVALGSLLLTVVCEFMPVDSRPWWLAPVRICVFRFAVPDHCEDLHNIYTGFRFKWRKALIGVRVLHLVPEPKTWQ